MTETTKRRVALDLSTLSVEERAHITAYVNAAAAQNYTTPAYESQQVARDPEILARALAFPLPGETPAPVAAVEVEAVEVEAAPLTPGPSPRRTRARGDAESPR